MYEITKGEKRINGELVETYFRSVVLPSCLIEVEAGTTGFRGGGRHAGGRCYLRFSNLNNADFYAQIHENAAGQPVSVELCFSGDDGLTAILRALDFAGRVLRDQAACMED